MIGFLSLPLFLDLYGVSLVHASWEVARVNTIKNRRPNGHLAIDGLEDIALENEATGFAEAVLTKLKGLEAGLPAPHCFHEIKGHLNTALRRKWWQASAMSWRDAAGVLASGATILEVKLDHLFCEAECLPPDLRGDIKPVVTLYRRSRDSRNSKSK